MARKNVPGVLASFHQVDAAVDAITGLKSKGFRDLTVYTAAPNHEIDAALDHPVSWVRMFTLIGGLTGVVTGYALTLWMANNWPIIVGGKPYSSVTPFTIIAFELTILFGVLMTVIGVFVFGKLPKFKLDAAYHPRFSAEEFGLAVRCKDRDVAEIDGLLRQHHATEVSLVEA